MAPRRSTPHSPRHWHEADFGPAVFLRMQRLRATAEAHEIADEVQAEVLDPVVATFADWRPAESRRLCDDLDRVLATPAFGGGA